jgi:hypothetical protein
MKVDGQSMIVKCGLSEHHIIGGPTYMQIDVGLRVFITFPKTVVHLLHMVIKFRTAFVAPSSQIFHRGDLVVDSSTIASRYLRSDFLVDLVATLPLPQVNQQYSFSFSFFFSSLIIKKDKNPNILIFHMNQFLGLASRPT